MKCKIASVVNSSLSYPIQFGGTNSASQSIGLAVASSELLTSRVNLIAFYFRRGGNLVYNSFDGAGANVSGTAALGTYDSIFIDRTADGYILGSITSAVETTQFTLTFDTDVTADGSTVGIYSDVRNADNVNTLNNFAVIPEPSTALLGALGALALLRRRR